MRFTHVDVRWQLGAVLALFLTCVSGRAEIMELSSAENVKGSLITVTNLNAWTLELVGAGQERELKDADGTRYDFEALHRGARIGYSPRSWLQLLFGLGAAQPDLGESNGEDGLDYSAKARIGLVKYILDSSVVHGSTHSVSLQADVSYSHADAQLDDLDFEWSEYMLAPQAVYAVDYRGARNWKSYDPKSVALRAGLLLSSVDGSWGSEDLEESRDFGWTAGGDLQFASDVVFGLTAYVLHSSEVTMELSLGYRF